jgi:hypothetical protein
MAGPLRSGKAKYSNNNLFVSRLIMPMKKLFLTASACLMALLALAQNTITINQSGGSGNRAAVSQQGSGNSISINQSSTHTSQSRQPGNQVSLRVDSSTQTTINQHGDGPNSVKLMQTGQATTTINQSSVTHENRVILLPRRDSSAHQIRTPKRRNRR